jgi:predicted O-methyltransferase YrrM
MTYTTDWFTRHIPLWQEQLKEFSDKNGLRFLEIGTFEGRSAIYLLDNFDCELTIIDTFKGSEEHAGLGIPADFQRRFEENIAPYRDRVIVCVGQSKQYLPTLIPGFNLIHVDGSHMAKDVLFDAMVSWELLKKGGIIIFDDYDWVKFIHQDKPWMTPTPALDAFLACMVGEYEMLHCDYQLILRKL